MNKVSKDLRVLQVFQAKPDNPERLVNPDLKENLDKPDLKVFQAIQVFLVRLVLVVQRVPKALLVKLDLPVSKVQWALRVHLARTEFPEKPDVTVNQAQMATQVSMAKLVLLVKLAQRVIKVKPVSMV